MESSRPLPITSKQWRFNRVIWGILFGVIFLDVVWGALLGWRADLHGIGIILTALSPFLLFLAVFTYLYKEPRFALMMHVFMQLILLSFTTAMFNYVTTTLALPMQDEALIAFDRAVGFDWLGYVTWVREHSWFARLLSVGYVSAWPQCMMAVVLLFLTGHFTRLQQFVFCIITGALLSIILAALIPAIAGYAHFNIDPSTLPGTDLPAAGLAHVEHYFMLREGAFHYVDFNFRGLITFPSYHTTFGLLLIYVFWPFRWLRPLALAANGLLILSVPVDGGHYLADLVGGAVVALAVVLLARKLHPLQKPDEKNVSPVEPGLGIK